MAAGGSSGSARSPGSYGVTIRLLSDRRRANYADDTGHWWDDFCNVRDLPAEECSSQYVWSFDGVRLESMPNHPVVSGRVRLTAQGINGPYEKAGGGKREWRNGGTQNECEAWSITEDSVFAAGFNVSWNGTSVTDGIGDTLTMRWQEDDPGTVDDKSIPYYLESRDLVEACLAGGGQTITSSTRDMTGPVTRYFPLLAEGAGHYDIDVWYRLECSVGGPFCVQEGQVCEPGAGTCCGGLTCENTFPTVWTCVPEAPPL